MDKEERKRGMDFIKRIAQINKLTADRDRWKAMALELGEELKKSKEALNKIIYKNEGCYFIGIVGDADVTDLVEGLDLEGMKL